MMYYIIVFKNTYDAMAAEKRLSELEIDFKIMPTPTSITMSCGICVRIDEKESIDKIVCKDTLKYKNIYFKDKDGYSSIQK